MQRDRVSTTHKETVYLEHKENVYLEPIHCAKRRTMSVKELVEVHRDLEVSLRIFWGL